MEALAIAAETRPDVVCMDIHMRGLNGIEATRRLVAAQPGVRVIGLSAYADKEYALEMCEAGALGYVTKGEAGDELLRAIRAGAGRQPYFSPEIAAAMADSVPTAAALGSYSPVQLDLREQEILKLLAEGCSLREVAQRLSTEECLVEAYRANILRKLGLGSNATLADYVKE
jgi:two-component system NarL family response regulator